MSIHPLLHVLVTRPQLLADHAEAYAGFVSEEISATFSIWSRRLVLYATALCLLGVCAVLGGVALMLWAVIPTSKILAPWALIAAPAVPASVAVVCLLLGRSQSSEIFPHVKKQLAADMMMIRDVAQPVTAA
jgi:uncharacterized membrane protein YqjE